MRVSTGPRIGHRKGAIVRYPKAFSDVYPCHGTRALNEKVRPLARPPRRGQKIVQPTTELRPS